MNALVGQEAKANVALIVADVRADDGRCKDGGDFTGARAGGHRRR